MSVCQSNSVSSLTEPVAWRWRYSDDPSSWNLRFDGPETGDDLSGYIVEALYAAPPHDPIMTRSESIALRILLAVALINGAIFGFMLCKALNQ